MRFTFLGLLAALALALAAPAPAAPQIAYGLQDDAWLEHGPGTLESRLARLDALGVKLVRFNVRWDAVAPRRPARPQLDADPAYDWSAADALLVRLRAHRIAVLLTLVGTPPWANGGRPSNWAPTSGRSFADFAGAVARRYPFVTRFEIWNEPNQRRFLRPTSPRVYTATLLNPAYAAIHRASPRALVAGGATAPRGATGGVSPVAWLAGMRAAGARLDAYAHHPYPTSPRTETPSAGGCDRCLTLTMAALPRLVGLVQGAWPGKQVWLTEYGYQTNPPDGFLGVSPALQARYLAEAAVRAYESPHVTMLVHYLYRDEPDPARFQSGLVYLSGRVKPAYAAYVEPLAQIGRRGFAVELWGQVRPGSGRRSYRLQRLRAGAWRPVGGPASTDARGILRRFVRAAPGTLLRIVAGRAVGAPLLVR